MKIDCKIPVNASREVIWSVITDFEHMVDNIQAITKSEILEKPSNSDDSLVGLKWMETRVMFGSEATETMWITDSVEGEYYQTRAENCGAVYISKMYVASTDGENHVGMSFDGEALSLCSKIMMVAMGWMMVGAMEKAVLQDLQDIKRIAEEKEGGGNNKPQQQQQQQQQQAEPTETEGTEN